MSFPAIPPDRSIGSSGHIEDHNEIVADLEYISSVLSTLPSSGSPLPLTDGGTGQSVSTGADLLEALADSGVYFQQLIQVNSFQTFGQVTFFEGGITANGQKINDIANGSAATDAAAVGQIVPLAYVQYAPSGEAQYSSSSETPAALDTTNLTISFTAPPSGAVLVRLSAPIYIDSASGYWCLLKHDTSTQVGNSAYVNQVNGIAFCSVPFVITGLTSGTSYQYDWAQMCNGTSMVTIAQGGTGLVYGAAIMEVWAA